MRWASSVATEPTQYLVSLIGWRHAFTVFAGLILLAALFILIVAPAKDTVGTPAPLRDPVRPDAFDPQDAAVLACCAVPWPYSGVQIGIQTLWAGRGFVT